VCSYFVDEFNEEYSRDIESMRGGHSDNYYYQLVSFVRYYKGVSIPPSASPPTTIIINKDFSQWSNVLPLYQDDQGVISARNHSGFGDTGLWYYHNSIVNDLCQSKVTHDSAALYFYLNTCDPQWQNGTNADHTYLYINTNNSKLIGWFGFDYMVNITEQLLYQHDSTNATEFSWKLVSKVQLVAGRSEVHLSLPADIIPSTSSRMQFNFKWWNGADWHFLVRDPIDFQMFGDAAPNNRFTYYYNNSRVNRDSKED